MQVQKSILKCGFILIPPWKLLWRVVQDTPLKYKGGTPYFLGNESEEPMKISLKVFVYFIFWTLFSAYNPLSCT